MRRIYLLLILVSLTLGIPGCLVESGETDNEVSPESSSLFEKPTNTYGLEDRIPGTIDNRRDALRIAAVAHEFAEQIRYDGEQSQPSLMTTTDVQATAYSLADYAYKGEALVTEDLAEVVREVFDKNLETDDDPEHGQDLTPDLRRKAEEIYRAIAWSLTKDE